MLLTNKELKLKEDLKRLINDKNTALDNALKDLIYLRNCMKEYKEYDKMES